MLSPQHIHYEKLSRAIVNCDNDNDFVKLDRLIRQDRACSTMTNVLGLSALHECAYAKNEFYAKKIMNSLILAGSDINAVDSGGASVLHHTVKKEKISLLKLLLSHPDINVNIASPLGSTALMLCIDKSRDYFFVKFNEQMAEKLDKKINKLSVYKKDVGIEMAALLLEYGADYENLQNSFKKTAKDLSQASPELFEAYEALVIEVEKEKLNQSVPILPLKGLDANSVHINKI